MELEDSENDESVAPGWVREGGRLNRNEKAETAPSTEPEEEFKKAKTTFSYFLTAIYLIFNTLIN